MRRINDWGGTKAGKIAACVVLMSASGARADQELTWSGIPKRIAEYWSAYFRDAPEPQRSFNDSSTTSPEPSASESERKAEEEMGRELAAAGQRIALRTVDQARAQAARAALGKLREGLLFQANVSRPAYHAGEAGMPSQQATLDRLDTRYEDSTRFRTQDYTQIYVGYETAARRDAVKAAKEAFEAGKAAARKTAEEIVERYKDQVRKSVRDAWKARFDEAFARGLSPQEAMKLADEVYAEALAKVQDEIDQMFWDAETEELRKVALKADEVGHGVYLEGEKRAFELANAALTEHYSWFEGESGDALDAVDEFEASAEYTAALLEQSRQVSKVGFLGMGAEVPQVPELLEATPTEQDFAEEDLTD